LEPALLQLGSQFSLSLKSASDEETKLEPDFDYYTGEEIILDKIFREQILLELPMSPVCQKDCLGLCPQCGKNKNKEKCVCQIEG
jgi:uncharacterized protein